ncbi:type II toxin-antitoxin system PemK/MazF family toxin [Daejeonella sp.]|uniref:type II toxin-antitoxin system PemK/MazF family toxin n=1 Tax=Daejeonella sp. TaxID=2805397 RepID=UPI0027315DE9|nr:type II toxin-antitoxin system PemK/MazF family toxin [Daejeonella sp.]MDP2414484.1 type II toxin-antitoxin system PemK/MazF family toxin [Daejeonella sp.]
MPLWRGYGEVPPPLIPPPAGDTGCLSITTQKCVHTIGPAVIVSADQLGKLPLSIIVPITDWKEHYSIAPWMIKLIATTQNGLSKTSSADCFQVRSVSQERFKQKIGYLRADQMEEIALGLSSALQIR